jgi:hypothetical protein
LASTIGIKIANGDFYSVLEGNSQDNKRLVLTTVHDNQQSVQIDLYKSSTRTMADALYIGSLVMENIDPQPKGKASIELVINSSINGNISASAVDMEASNGGRNTLNVSLESLEAASIDLEIPDFELEQDYITPKGLYGEIEEKAGGEKRHNFPWIIVTCAALILTAIGLAIWLFLFQSGNNLESATDRIRQLIPGNQSRTISRELQPELEADSPSSQASQAPQPVMEEMAETPQPETAEAVQSPPVIQAPASGVQIRQRPVPPVFSYTIPSVIPREGVPYRIRYGDTLWDIAEAFYRNPMLYPRIARFNNIRNPDRIISGTTIRVPPRN